MTAFCPVFLRRAGLRWSRLRILKIWWGKPLHRFRIEPYLLIWKDSTSSNLSSYSPAGNITRIYINTSRILKTIALKLIKKGLCLLSSKIYTKIWASWWTILDCATTASETLRPACSSQEGTPSTGTISPSHTKAKPTCQNSSKDTQGLSSGYSPPAGNLSLSMHWTPIKTRFSSPPSLTS